MRSLVASIAGAVPYRQRALEKQQIRDLLRVRGGTGRPEAPRDVYAQPSSRSVFLSWKLPVNHTSVAGWRIYKNTESELVAEIRDKGTRQVSIPVDSGATPPIANFFVCSFSTLGRESPKVLVQSAALVESGAPAVATVPPGYLAEASGGGDRQLVEFRGRQQYVR